MASRLKLTAIKLSKCIPAGSTPWSPRVFVTAAKPLQKTKSDKEVEETCKKVTEAAEAVRDGAKEVGNMTKVVSGKVSEVTDNIIDKAKDTVIQAATEKIKEKVSGK